LKPFNFKLIFGKPLSENQLKVEGLQVSEIAVFCKYRQTAICSTGFKHRFQWRHLSEEETEKVKELEKVERDQREAKEAKARQQMASFLHHR
jgi:hypothetical protein